MSRIGLWVILFGATLVAFAQVPSISHRGVVNAASSAVGQVVAPGSLVTIYGSELASGLAQADSIPLATRLNNVRVTIWIHSNFDPYDEDYDYDAPLLFVSGGQINAQLPWSIPPGDALVTVADTRTGVFSETQYIRVGPFSPGIFAVNFGVGQAIATNLDGSLAAPRDSIPGLATHPVKVGEFIIILATGLGAVDIPIQDGHNSLDEIRNTTTKPTVIVGGVPVIPDFSGLSPQFVGVNQLNVKIPPGVPIGDAIPLQLQVGGITSTDQVTIAIE